MLQYSPIMKKLSLSILLSTVFLFAATTLLQAGGGGRAPITVTSTGAAGSKSAEIYATVYKDNDIKYSVGEKGIFRIKNAGSGQSCITKSAASDDQGKIYGSCSSPTAGEIEVYIHFPDKVEDATPYKVSFVEKGQAVTTKSSSTPTGPCGSGLTSYGWDPSNGRTCEPLHFNAWTAYCGNGYKQDVQLNSCVNANTLTDDPERKKIAEAICASTKCGTTSSTKSVSSPSPTPQASVQPQAISKYPIVQYLVTEQKNDHNGVDLDLYLKARVETGYGRVYLIPLMASAGDPSNIRVELLSNDEEPWNYLTEKFGLNFSSAGSYAQLALAPQVYEPANRNDLYQALEAQGIKKTTDLTQAVDRAFMHPINRLLVVVTKPGTAPGSWLPALKISGIGEGIQQASFPPVWNISTLAKDYTMSMEIGVLSIDAYRANSSQFKQTAYKFDGYGVKLNEKIVSAAHLTEMYVDYSTGKALGLIIQRDYPENAKISELPLQPAHSDVIQAAIESESKVSQNPFFASLNIVQEKFNSFVTILRGWGAQILRPFEEPQNGGDGQLGPR
jgi:hypothetical protein